MNLLQMPLKLFGLGDKFKIETIIKDILMGGKSPGGAGGPADGAAAAPGGIGLSLDELKDLFQNKGLGEVFASWVGKGKNAPVTGDQIKGLFSGDELKALAAKSGLPVDALCQKLAKYLPGVVDKLTPGGALPA